MMLFICVIITSILAIQTIQTAISPANLRAMATLQAQRAMAIANALRARAHYNALMARTNLGLLDHRVIRNSDNQIIDDADFEYDDEDIPFLDENYEEITLPETNDDISTLFPLDFNVQGGRNGLESLVGANEGFVHPEQIMDNPDPEIPCAYSDLRENSHPDDLNMIQAPLMEDLHEIITNYEPVPDDQFSHQRRQITPLGCQRPLDQTNSVLENAASNVDSNLGMQAAFPAQAFAANQPQFGQQVYVPWQLMPQGIPAMQIVPQMNMNPYGNFPIQPLSTLQPGSQMIFLRQAPSQETDKSKSHGPEKSSVDHSIGSIRTEPPNVGAASHTHTYTHTHTHFKDPNRNILIPNTQIVTPGLNLHVVQNQNSVVPPQQIPSASIQPGFNTDRGTFGSNTYSPNGYGVVKPGISASQSQVIHTNVPNRQYNVAPNMGATTFTQSQTLHQGRSHENPAIGMELKQLPFPNLDQNNEKLGTVLTDFRMRAPESPENFDPNRPQNLQPVVNYIERQDGSIKKLVHSIENNENLHRFETPLRSELEYVGFPSSFEENRNIQNEYLGSFPLENIQINPPPMLPPNFNQLNSQQRQEAMDRYLQEEQANTRNFLEQVEENNRRTFDKLSNLVDVDPAFMTNTRDFQNSPSNSEDNINNIQVVSSTVMDPRPQQMTNGVSSDTNINLGHIIDVPQRRESEWFQRLARSPNKTVDDKLDNLLLAEKDIINELKKDAKHDEDLMMIGYIGDNMIEDLEKKSNETKRPKRSITGSPYNLPLNRLVTDPRAALNIPRTLDNLGAVVKNTFEHENAPLYHVRNMMGSAQDAVLATMKIPSKNFLIPSQYDIVRRQGNNEILQDINPNLFSEKYSPTDAHPNNIAHTFQKVGNAVRSGVLSSQEALSHAGQVANHAKNAVHSTRYTTPRLLLNRIPAVTTQPIRKTVLLTPRILDVANEGEQLGNALDNSQEQFVKVGYLLDAIGVSNPNYNDVHFQKLIVEPKKTDRSRPSRVLENLLGNIRVEEIKGDEDPNLLGDTMNTLDKVKESFGVDNLKELFDKVKNKLNGVLENGVPVENMKPTEHKTKPVGNDQNAEINKSQMLSLGTPQQNNGLHNFITDNQLDQNQEILEARLIPENLLHPFMGHFPQNQLWNEANAQTSLDENQRDTHLAQILGAINPLMFEKLFNESLNTENNFETPQSIIPDYDEDVPEKENNDEEVGTNMQFSQAMLRPFMGRANSKMEADFLHKYTPDAMQSQDESSEHKRATETPEWVEVDINQGNGLENEE